VCLWIDSTIHEFTDNKHQENKKKVNIVGDGYVGGSSGVYFALTHSCIDTLMFDLLNS